MEPGTEEQVRSKFPRRGDWLMKVEEGGAGCTYGLNPKKLRIVVRPEGRHPASMRRPAALAGGPYGPRNLA